MKTYIQETIQELVAEIAKLQDTVIVLQRIGGNERSVASAPAGPARKEGEKKARLDPRGAPAREAALKLKEPFDAQSLATAANISKKAAEANIYRWQGLGYVRKHSLGKFNRTETFPGKVTQNAEALRRQIHEEIAAGEKP